MKIRIQFSKHGAMKFIGHLDVMRYFQKAMRRAEIDIAYTGGFSPHQIMSFAAPLGVGLESDGEYFDIEVNSYNYNGTEQMTEALNRVMAEGIRILSVKVLPDDAKNAMASVAAAGYKIKFRKEYEPAFDYRPLLMEFYHKKTLPYVKKTKKGTVELNLRPAIYDLHINEDSIEMLVDASSAGNIKPGMVMDAFYKEQGMELPEFALEITRTDTYMNVGTKEEPVFEPLGNVGKEL